MSSRRPDGASVVDRAVFVCASLVGFEWLRGRSEGLDDVRGALESLKYSICLLLGRGISPWLE